MHIVISPMKTLTRLLPLAVAILMLVACEQPEREAEPDPVTTSPPGHVQTPADNPLLGRYLTPFQTPPLHRTEPGDFLPALQQVIEQREALVDTIIGDEAPASFDNTTLALEMGSRELQLISRTFFSIVPVAEDPGYRELASEFAAKLTEHLNRVHFNARLFERIEAVRENVSDLADAEKRRLVKVVHDRFVHAGSALDEDDRQTLLRTNRELAELERQLEASMNAATGRYELLLEDPARLQGLPEMLVNQAARNARERGHNQGWVITLHDHSLRPFLRHSPDRQLREELYTAWRERVDISSGNHQPPASLMEQIAGLRARRAQLHGYDSHIDYRLVFSGIGSLEQARELIEPLADAAREHLDDELRALRELARADGIEENLQPWDWWYYTERLRERELEIGEAAIREWFPLDQVREGAFALTNRLWGLSYHERTDLPMWHPEVQAFEVRDAMGEHLGVIYFDLRHRAGKYGGHWTSTFRASHRDEGDRVAPIVAGIANFPPATAGTPSLLSPDEVRILFGQLGQALHELFAEVGYPSLASSAAAGDFRQFPAQLMARWALEPDVLRIYAFHHETGSIISDEVLEALRRETRLTAGMETMQQLAAIELDLALHGGAEVPGLAEAERSVIAAMNLPGTLSPRHYGDGLSVLFSSDATNDDLGRLWAELLAADVFAAFHETTVLDRELAGRLREEILSRGNAVEPLTAFRAFRGREPQIQHLLEARGLGTP